MSEKVVNEFLVMGNGFDLQCNLKTKYQDFFYHRFGINLIIEIFKNRGLNLDKATKEAVDFFKETFKEKIEKFTDKLTSLHNSNTDTKNSNGWVINYYTQSFREIFDNLNKDSSYKLNDKIIEFEKTKLNNWDIIFLYCFIYLKTDAQIYWNDVESIIYEVVTAVLLQDEQALSDKGFSDSKIRKKFIQTIEYSFSEQNKDVSTAMLERLKKFEEGFAEYINKVIADNEEEYYNSAAKLLNQLTGSNKKYHVNLDVINFNYSLNESMVNKLLKQEDMSNIKINSWVNIHGIAAWHDKETKKDIHKLHGGKTNLAAPIFGIDGHDVLSTSEDKILNLNDERIPFTKSFRLLDNHVNVMRDRNHQFQTHVDQIIFFGHSLGHADYSYFETLFDIYKIYDSDVILNFYYCKHKAKLENRNSEREVLKNLINLLTSYGQTLPNQHGENIVNRLMLEQRLNLLPSPSK